MTASDVKVGDTIRIWQSSESSDVVVREVCINAHYGWIGFVFGPTSLEFVGWFNPSDEVFVI